MAQTQPLTPLSAIQRYSLAVISVAAAMGESLLMERANIRNVEVPLCLFAVACVTFDYFFIEPLFTFVVSRADLPYFTVFASFASLVTWFSAVRRRVEAELQIEVAERTQQASLLNLTHDTIFSP